MCIRDSVPGVGSSGGFTVVRNQQPGHTTKILEGVDVANQPAIGANLKYYFTDLGLRNVRLNFRQQESTHIMENIVYSTPFFCATARFLVMAF